MTLADTMINQQNKVFKQLKDEGFEIEVHEPMQESPDFKSKERQIMA